MKRNQLINISPGSRVTNKRTREINYHDNSNKNTVSDASSTHVESERLESNLNSNEYNLRSKNPPVVDEAEIDVSRNSLKRLQQPPAYINPNLNKIKIESDYNPIVAVKHESPTGDENQDIVQSEVNNENEGKKVDTSSFSLDSSKNNINNEFSTTDLEDKMQSAIDNKSEITLNVNELHHLLNIIQSSQEKAEGSKTKHHQQQRQEKEKVVVKVEPVEKENETEKKEKETIAELEERINKYTKKVISLHREKAEIQTTLQNKIQQLNLVIGQHETQVEHQKGIIDVQLEEINRLKSQVNQKPIPQLNEELKLNSQNQDPVTCKNVKQVKIQDFPTKVLSRIFDFLDLQSLKQSRFVCRPWKQEAGKILLSKYYVTIGWGSGKSEPVLQNWLTNSYSTVKAQKMSVYDGKRTGQRTSHLLKKFPALRCSVRELKYNEKSQSGPSDSEKLYEVIKLLPKLEKLETGMLNLSPSQKWLGDVTSFSNKNPIKLELFIRKLETLKKLKLDFVLSQETSACFMAHYNRFSCIQSMEIHAEGMPVLSSFLGPNLDIWSITHLSLNLNDPYDVKLIRRFLARISQSLQHLKIMDQNSFSSLSSSLYSFDPWADGPTWLIPMGLNRKSLKIGFSGFEFYAQKNFTHLNTFMLKSLIFSLRLPSLKKLTVPFIPSMLEEIIHKWTNQQIAGGRKFINNNSLEELELTSYVSSASAGRIQTIPVKMWPRLKILKCSWSTPESFDASFVSQLGVSENLERFHVVIGYGKEQTEDGIKKCDNANPWQFNLSDLKNLKSFCLESRLNEPRHQNLAIRLIESHLKFMKSLQCVQFQGVVVDGEALKSALGPNVPVIFTK